MPSRKKIFPTSTLIIGIMLGATLFFGIQKWANPISALISTPMLLAQHKISQTITNIKKRKTKNAILKKYIIELEKENAKLIEQLTKQSAITANNKSFEALISFAERYQLVDAKPVQILLKHITDNTHYILVGGGENKKIKKDDIALHHHQLIGKVTKVYPFYSKVQLITDPTSRIAVECAATNTRGIAEGTGDPSALNLSFAAHFTALKDQDTVLSLGTGLIFPRGFGIGIANKKTTKDVFHSATITPLIKIEKLEECLIASRERLEAIALAPKKTLNTNKKPKSVIAKQNVSQPKLTIPLPPEELPVDIPHLSSTDIHPTKQMDTGSIDNQTQTKTVGSPRAVFDKKTTLSSDATVEKNHRDIDQHQGEPRTQPNDKSAALKSELLYD